ncbi:MAG: phosphatidate cytidylyltransferase [Candidatus Cloacimonetes bacterium]|nr:SEC59/DGK1/VTE5 family protein [Candidatus Cloacimonadota bacterium]NLO11632.1 phosphatidate cytidylyltransferase [Candidatus Cloacimonadota bacterium]
MVKLKEMMRKGIHISSLVIPLSYRYIIGFHHRKLTFSILLVCFVLSLTIEFYRFWQRSFRVTFYRVFGMVLRRHEINNFTGATYLLFSAMLVVAFFPPKIAFCAMAYLSIGDTLAALVGMNWGKRKFLGMSKSLEGSLACFLGTLIFGVFYLPLPQAIIGAVSATLAELWDLPIDDNIKIPITSALVLALSGIFV